MQELGKSPRRRRHTIAPLVSITMSEQEVPSSVAQRIIIKFLTVEDIKPFQILRRLKRESIRLVGRLFEDDSLLAVAEITSEVGIRYGSAQAIITDDTGFRKMSIR